MEFKDESSIRGFKIITFKDRYGENCSLQKSSLASEEAIWLGISEAKPKIMASDTKTGGDVGWLDIPVPETVLINTRMHLTQAQVKDLLPILQKFAETGEI